MSEKTPGQGFCEIKENKNIYIKKGSKIMTNIELVNKAIEVALCYNTVYANGMFGHTLDYEYPKEEGDIIDQKARQLSAWYNKNNNKARVKSYKGMGYFGFDCVCFVKSLIWGWNGNLNSPTGGANYGSNNMPDMSEKEIIESKEGGYEQSTDFTNLVPGEFLYYETASGGTHCGLYIGDGFAVECTTEWENKVQITVVKNIKTYAGYHERLWKSHRKLPCIDYDSETINSGPLHLKNRVYQTRHGIRIDVDALDSRYSNAWIGLYRADIGGNYANSSLGIWKNISNNGGKISLLAAQEDAAKKITYALPNGAYKVVLFKDQGYSMTHEARIQIKGAKVCEARYADGWVDISIHGLLREGDWIGIYPNGTQNYDQNHKSDNWQYIPQDLIYKKNFFNHYYLRTRMPFHKTNPASYKVVLFSGSGYTVASEHTIDTVGCHPDVTVDPIEPNTTGEKLIITSHPVYSGMTIDVSYYGLTDKDAWIGLYPYQSNGDYSKCTTGMWCYAATGQQWGIRDSKNMVKNGKVRLRANIMDVNTGTMRYLTPGNYQIVIFNNGGYTVYEKSYALNVSPPRITLKEASLTKGEYTFLFNGLPTYSSWVGIYDKYETDYKNYPAIAWSHTPHCPGTCVVGEVQFSCQLMPSKYYKAVLFVNSDDEGDGGETYRSVASCEFLVPWQ